MAGGIAAFLTNSIELLAVNRQTDKNFKVRKFLLQKGAINKMFFQGV
jgi:hypothetical protein